LLDSSARGVFVIAPTPFAANGAIDERSTDSMVDAFLAAGADGITLLGIMGEAPKLTAEESLRFAGHAIRRIGGRSAVVIGVSSPGFAAMAALSKAVMDMGADGVMIAPPAAMRTEAQITSYFTEACEAIGADVPFVLQDYPQATNVLMPAPLILRLVEALPNLVMLKHEDWPGLDKLTAVRRLSDAEGLRRISILCGNGGLFLPYEMERGADGAMTGYPFPEMLVAVVALVARGERAAAHDLFDRHLPLIRYETQPGIGLAVRKYVLKRRGIIANDTLRKPRPALTPETIGEIEWMLRRIEGKA
jgi:4-hydroxy-tetrahydrodipicolinate synthase